MLVFVGKDADLRKLLLQHLYEVRRSFFTECASLVSFDEQNYDLVGVLSEAF